MIRRTDVCRANVWRKIYRDVTCKILLSAISRVRLIKFLENGAYGRIRVKLPRYHRSTIRACVFLETHSTITLLKFERQQRKDVERCNQCIGGKSEDHRAISYKFRRI